MKTSWSRQAGDDVRFEWGPAGIEVLRGDIVVVVDVLRFTTAVEAATSRGAEVFPYRPTADGAVAYARLLDAGLADGADERGLSLSPASLLRLDRGERIVLPSLNGSACSVHAEEEGATVVAACLRNAGPVAARAQEQGGTVAVIACGERWPDGSLRPALEDYLGAGAVIANLRGTRSPEVRAAASAWGDLEDDVAELLATCSSGRECQHRGWSEDLRYAGEVGSSGVVPVLQAGAFVDVST